MVDAPRALRTPAPGSVTHDRSLLENVRPSLQGALSGIAARMQNSDLTGACWRRLTCVIG
jgi:hypothetical protein